MKISNSILALAACALASLAASGHASQAQAPVPAPAPEPQPGLRNLAISRGLRLGTAVPIRLLREDADKGA